MEVLQILTIIYSSLTAVILILGFIATFFGTLKNNYFRWTLRCECIAGILVEVLKFLTSFKTIVSSPIVCETLAVIMNAAGQWRNALIVIYLGQVCYVLCKRVQGQPLYEDETKNISNRARYITSSVLYITPLVCLLGFWIPHVISKYGFRSPLFDWREQYQRCDFHPVVNTIVMVSGIMIATHVSAFVAGICTRHFLKEYHLFKDKERLKVYGLFVYPFVWCISMIVIIVGLILRIWNINHVVLDYVYLFLGGRFQEIMFPLVNVKWSC